MTCYLVFTLAGCRYALDLAQVAEVVEQAETWPIPLAPPCYRGAMNFHGAIAAVMDLAQFLCLPGNNKTEKLVVLAPGTASLAFIVESIIRITPPGQTEMQTIGNASPYSPGELSLPDGRAILLDAAAIAEHAAETING